jgi:signal transduction histidine kinase
MRSARTADPGTRRLRRLVLWVLATITIPSLLLSGFGLIAIQNERDAAQERVRDLYGPVAFKLAGQVKERLREVLEAAPGALAQLERLGLRQTREPGAALGALRARQPGLTNFFVLDRSGGPRLPPPADPLPSWSGAPLDPLEEGLRLEFEAAEPSAAAAHYRAQLARLEVDPAVAACLARDALRALGQEAWARTECRRAGGLGLRRCPLHNGLARSLDRAGLKDEALSAWAEVAESCADFVVAGGYNLGLGASLRRLELLWAGAPEEALAVARGLAERLGDPHLPASGGQVRFVATRVATLLEQDSRPAARALAGQFEALATRDELVAAVAAQAHTLVDRPELRSVKVGHAMRMVLVKGGEAIVGAELVPSVLAPGLQANLDELEVDGVQVALVQSMQPIDDGSEGLKAAAVLISDGGFAWRLDLNLRRGTSLDDLARTRTRLYVWVLVLLVVVLVAGISATLWLLVRESRLSRLKTDFVSNVSHELRTPLTSIRMFTETLQLGRVQDEAERQECLQIIAQESERLSRLVERVLDFSRMEAGRRAFRKAPEAVAGLVEAALAACRSDIQARGFQVRVELPADLPRVSVDRDALVEVLINLLSNAMKYSPRSREVTLSARQAGDTLELMVRDEGIGIPRHEHERIFEKFYRVETSLTGEVSGSGLGLSLVRYIVEGHGGQVRVESEPGQGSCFRVRLPLVEDRLAGSR